LAMNLEGPLIVRLIFHAFVVVVGAVILAGAVNTAIVGSNGVLNRVSEDGVLSDWFCQPHPRFGTSYRIINIIVLLQILTILISFINPFTKPVATVAGGACSVLHYIVFTISERRGRKTRVAHEEMDEFNLELEGELTPESVGAGPGNIPVPVSNHFNMYHLGN